MALLERIADTLLVVLDSDKAGFIASSRTVKLALGTGLDVSVIALPKGKDPAEFALENPDGWREKIKSGKQFVDYALEFIAAEAPSTKEEEKLIREHLYPFIASMRDALRKDQSLVKISMHMKLSPDALREDFANWRGNQLEEKVSPKIKESSTAPRKDRIRDSLIGIALWQKGTEHSAMIASKLKELLGEKSGELILLAEDEETTSEQQKRRESLVFEAESYYNSHKSLISEIDTLLRALEKEILTLRLEDALISLRKAEASGDTALVTRLLGICQEISLSINSLNNINR